MVNVKVKGAEKDILEAARKTYTDKSKTLTEVAAQFGVSRGIITEARIIVKYGTEREIDLVAEGKVGFTTIAAEIKQRLDPETRRQLKKNAGGVSTTHRDTRQQQADIWSKFAPMLHGVLGLPSPEDMVTVVKANQVRTRIVNENIEIATIWMEEFANAWQKHVNSKSNGSDVNAGRSNEAA